MRVQGSLGTFLKVLQEVGQMSAGWLEVGPSKLQGFRDREIPSERAGEMQVPIGPRPTGHLFKKIR